MWCTIPKTCILAMESSLKAVLLVEKISYDLVLCSSFFQWALYWGTSFIILTKSHILHVSSMLICFLFFLICLSIFCCCKLTILHLNNLTDIVVNSCLCDNTLFGCKKKSHEKISEKGVKLPQKSSLYLCYILFKPDLFFQQKFTFC